MRSLIPRCADAVPPALGWSRSAPAPSPVLSAT
jgi:hypothetical protein